MVNRCTARDFDPPVQFIASGYYHWSLNADCLTRTLRTVPTFLSITVPLICPCSNAQCVGVTGSPDWDLLEANEPQAQRLNEYGTCLLNQWLWVWVQSGVGLSRVVKEHNLEVDEKKKKKTCPLFYLDIQVLLEAKLPQHYDKSVIV